ncbi:Hypothetical protein, putative, partial [Bodo saltans]
MTISFAKNREGLIGSNSSNMDGASSDIIAQTTDIVEIDTKTTCRYFPSSPLNHLPATTSVTLSAQQTMPSTAKRETSSSHSNTIRMTTSSSTTRWALMAAIVTVVHMLLLSHNSIGTHAQTCTYSSFTFTTTATNIGASCQNLLVQTSTASGLSLGAKLANFDASTGAISLSFTGNTFKSQLNLGQTVSGLTITGWTTAPSATITSVSINIDSNSLGNATLQFSGIFPSGTVVSISNNNFVQWYPNSNGDRVANLYFAGVTMTGTGSSLIATKNTMYANDIEGPSVYPPYSIFTDRWLLSNLANVTFSSNSITAVGDEQAAMGIWFSSTTTYSLDIRSGASMNFIYNSIKISSTGSNPLYGVHSDFAVFVNGLQGTTRSQWNIVGNFIGITAGISASRGISFGNTASGVYTNALGITGGAVLSLNYNSISM